MNELCKNTKEFKDESMQYFMGVDAYDGKNFAACVMAKNVDGEIIVVYNGRSNNKDDFEKEVKMIAAYYDIPDDKIMKEQP